MIKILKEFIYYFFLLPSYSLNNTSNVYKKLGSWAQERQIDLNRKAKVIRNLDSMFGQSIPREEIEHMAERFFSILSCDDIDAYLKLFKSWKEIRKIIKVEGGEIFKAFAEKRKGCILLSAHYGGAFFIFNIIKELGGKPQVLGRPIKKAYFRGNSIRWIYLKLRVFSMERAIGEKMIFTEGKDTKKELIKRLEQGYHIVITFDVPPIFTKGRIGEVRLLGRKWHFPLGFLELLIGRDFAIIPFFTFMNEHWERIFQFYPPYWIEKEEELLNHFQRSVNIFEKHLRMRPEQWFFWDDAQVFW